jgi:hypothetical protein
VSGARRNARASTLSTGLKGARNRSRCAAPIALLAPSLLLLAACSSGDFGRARYPWLPEPSPSVPAARAYAPEAISAFPLTDEERQLRKLADGLLAPPFEQSRWFVTAAGGHGAAAPPPAAFDRASYTANLLQGHFRSATSRYARLIDDIRDDGQRMDTFFAMARRVGDLDHKRMRSLAHVSGLSDAELANTQARVRENIAIMTSVRDALGERCADYRFALERLVIALPSPMAVEAERQWAEFKRRLTGVQVVAGVANGSRLE